jgi:hypothetical protein
VKVESHAIRFAFALHCQSLKQTGREELAQAFLYIRPAQRLSRELGQMAGQGGKTSG